LKKVGKRAGNDIINALVVSARAFGMKIELAKS